MVSPVSGPGSLRHSVAHYAGRVVGNLRVPGVVIGVREICGSQWCSVVLRRARLATGALGK